MDLDQKFQVSSGAHSICAAEMTFLRKVQSTECMSTFYNEAFAFAVASKDAQLQAYSSAPLDLLPTCQPKELTFAQLQGRQALLDLLTAYADSIQALMSDGNDQAFDSGSESMAKGLQSVAKQAGFTTITTNEAAGVNAAIDTITHLIVDHHEYDNVKDAASKAELPLESIVNAFKSENSNDASGIQSKLGGIKNDFRIAVLASRDHKGAASFLDIADAHAMLASMTVATDPTQLNAALDALVASNKTLASGDKTTVHQVVSNLVSEGQRAVTIYSGSK
ncbi:hypothetical protein [Dyella acidiphila]|uniref:Uncharacterized protein n=1 Tax=Dyella acidiphila TaxID=2775866 RepID=A0ABR9GG85_9GAMM|nr:hypothetical protein [Dyella acidiphila]MBE1163041.1 hypothetical protein [Dyella acidiphila]